MCRAFKLVPVQSVAVYARNDRRGICKRLRWVAQRLVCFSLVTSAFQPQLCACWTLLIQQGGITRRQDAFL